jgi:hypothetical protein
MADMFVRGEIFISEDEFFHAFVLVEWDGLRPTCFERRSNSVAATTAASASHSEEKKFC